ncbi:ATP-binding protein [Pseudomonas zeae]|uniref:ATP-binding protein n=1 Tax=Pseudomonas zeae TaxID=2745510 RepID=UPI002147293B|nr:ATP-binding protein [Pseudomonas zeae]UUT10417.1 ATP-binding protein [Pseudomonas zeae]
MTTYNPAPDLKIIETIPISPHAGKVTDALSRIGYTVEEAIADLIDNSIDASASSILVRFVHDGAEIRRIVIGDNGSGMSKDQLLSAMQFGSDRERAYDALGKFGMGLKTAALSQGRSLTVVSKQNLKVTSCRWTAKSIASGWNCEILDSKGAKVWLDEIRHPFTIDVSGTLVVIDGIDHALSGTKGLEATLQKLHKKLSIHLGLVFHRFIDAGLNLYLDAANINGGDAGFSVPIKSLNPFNYAVTGHKDYPLSFSIKLRGLPALRCNAHIWPPNQTSQSYFLSSANVATRQGFYFYRNGRLIQAGGWNGWRENTNDHHLTLARVEIELPPQFDTEFRLNVQKSGLDVPEGFRSALSSASNPMTQYIKNSEEVYRKKAELEENFVPIPGRGFGSTVRRRAKTYLAGKKSPTREINILWGKLPELNFFQIDRTAGNVILNALYRQDLLQGSTATLNDTPIIKTLLFLLLRDDLLRERGSKRFTERLEEINELLMLAIKEEQSRQTS